MMLARDVIGRKIVAVQQDRVHDEMRGFYWEVRGFTLDNGTELLFQAHEAEVAAYVGVTTCKPEPMRDEVKELKIEMRIARDSTEEEDL
jgi:hypothetical protein